MRRRSKRNSCNNEEKECCLRYILGLLKRRPYPLSVLRNKLQRKGCKPDLTEEVMVKLTEIINVDSLTEEFLNALYLGAVRKGKGPHWFERRAYGAGLNNEVINSYINQFDWREALRVCVLKAKVRYGNDIYRIKNYMYRSGFDESFWDIAKDILKEG